NPTRPAPAGSRVFVGGGLGSWARLRVGVRPLLGRDAVQDPGGFCPPGGFLGDKSFGIVDVWLRGGGGFRFAGAWSADAGPVGGLVRWDFGRCLCVPVRNGR